MFYLFFIFFCYLVSKNLEMKTHKKKDRIVMWFCVINWNVQPKITDFPGLNVTFPNCLCSQLVIQAIEDFVPNRVDNRKVLSLIYVSLHDLYAHTATHPATFQVIVYHLLLGLSGNCPESMLLRERAKIIVTNKKLH